MRKKSDFCGQQAFCFSQAPVLSVLIPVGVENWRQEGLFRRGKYSAGQKMRFVMRLRARAFDYAARDVREAKGAGREVSRGMIQVEKKVSVLREFGVVSDKDMREIMKSMIVRENLIGARYVARQLKIAWPQFVLDFNYGLEQMMEIMEAKDER